MSLAAARPQGYSHSGRLPPQGAHKYVFLLHSRTPPLDHILQSLQVAKMLPCSLVRLRLDSWCNTLHTVYCIHGVCWTWVGVATILGRRKHIYILVTSLPAIPHYRGNYGRNRMYCTRIIRGIIQPMCVMVYTMCGSGREIRWRYFYIRLAREMQEEKTTRVLRVE